MDFVCFENLASTFDPFLKAEPEVPTYVPIGNA